MPSLTSMKTSPGVTGSRRGKLLRIFLFLLLFLVAAFVFLQSAFFEVKNIAVGGNRGLTTEQVLQLAGLNNGKNIFKLNLKEATRKLYTHPLIKNVEISRRLPSTIQIQIIERVPLALVPGEGGFVQVDGEGVYLAKTRDMLQVNLPLITKINTGAASPGERIDNSRLKLGLSFVKGMSKALRNVISEINVNDPEQVLLYTIDGVEIRAGGGDRLIEKLETVKEVLNQYGKQAVYIDISFKGPPVVKTLTPQVPENKKKEENKAQEEEQKTGENVTSNP